MNPMKIQGRGLSVKFVGVIWSGKTEVLPAAVINKIQDYPFPTKRKMLQEFFKSLDFWKASIPHLTRYKKPLCALIRKGQQGDWQEKHQQPFEEAKRAVKQAQALGIYDPAPPGKLETHVTQEGMSWDLWQ